MTSQTPLQYQEPQPEKKGKTDEEENHPEEMKENKTDGKDKKADEEKEKTCIQKRGAQATILLAIITIIVSIVMPLTLKKLDRKYWGGEACKTNENCFSQRCDLDLNICFCKDEENKAYCRDSTFMCIDKFQCDPKPTAAPTCDSSILLGNENEVLAEDVFTNANFGWSVSIDRSIAVVGAPHRAGSAYVLERRGSEWKEVAKLPSDTTPSYDFGLSVAIDGDTIIVGARGSAYVFQNTNGSEWDFVTKLETNEGGYDKDKFGRAVALDGNTAIVGAVGDGTTAIGSAHIFVRENSQWAFQKRIFASDGTAGDDFGRSVAVHGDTAIVGKISSAFIFSRNGSDWDVGKRLIPKDAPIEYMFGYNVAINKDTAVIGAIGAAYIFTLSGSELLSVEIPDLASRAASVALDGNTLVLGSAGHNSISTYARDGFEWKEAAKITATSVSTDVQFGSSIAVSENVVMIGAPGSPDRQGSIYIMDYVACV